MSFRARLIQFSSPVITKLARNKSYWGFFALVQTSAQILCNLKSAGVQDTNHRQITWFAFSQEADDMGNHVINTIDPADWDSTRCRDWLAKIIGSKQWIWGKIHEAYRDERVFSLGTRHNSFLAKSEEDRIVAESTAPEGIRRTANGLEHSWLRGVIIYSLSNGEYRTFSVVPWWIPKWRRFSGYVAGGYCLCWN